GGGGGGRLCSGVPFQGCPQSPTPRPLPAAQKPGNPPQQVKPTQPALPQIRVMGRRAVQRGPVRKPQPEAAAPSLPDNKQTPSWPLAGVPMTPLNVVPQSATRLGLPVIQTPASVEVVDRKVIEEQGYRTTTETAQGAVGVIAGDSAGAP